MVQEGNDLYVYLICNTRKEEGGELISPFFTLFLTESDRILALKEQEANYDHLK